MANNKYYILFICLLLPISLVSVFLPIAEALSLTDNDPYPHVYSMEWIVYRVSTISSVPEWYNEEDDYWNPSEDYPTEQELIKCHWIKRIRLD